VTHYLGALTRFINNFEPRANLQNNNLSSINVIRGALTWRCWYKTTGCGLQGAPGCDHT